MSFFLFIAAGWLVYKLLQARKSRQIVMNRYIEATNQMYGYQQPAPLMYDPQGKAHPMWCPNCGKNL